MTPHIGEMMRYSTNGLVATAVHYLVLYACVELLNFSSVGLSNFLASMVGVLVSFAGNKYFVFKLALSPVTTQLIKFLIFYAVIAFIHGAFLYIWSDIFKKNFNSGFAIAVIIQLLLGFISSKFLIFTNAHRKLKFGNE